MIGVSRKSFLQINNDSPVDRQIVSLTAQSLAAYNGADIIRTHDVDKTLKSLSIIERIIKI